MRLSLATGLASLAGFATLSAAIVPVYKQLSDVYSDLTTAFGEKDTYAISLKLDADQEKMAKMTTFFAESSLDAVTELFHMGFGTWKIIVCALNKASLAILAGGVYDDVIDFIERPDTMNIAGGLPSTEGVSRRDIKTLAPAPWNLARLCQQGPVTDSQAAELQYQYHCHSEQGRGVTAYILDTGMDWRHSEFEPRGRARWGAHLVAGDEECEPFFYPYISDCVWKHGTGAAKSWKRAGRTDESGHGTLMAGIVAGEDYGVAKKATTTSVKVCDADGACPIIDVLRGLQWVFRDSGCKKNVEKSVVLLGFTGEKSVLLERVVSTMTGLGFVFVVPAGESAEIPAPGSEIDAGDYYPAGINNMVVVGASDIQDQWYEYGHVGSAITLIAPGVGITGPVSDRDKMHQVVDERSGTSLAAAHVAGVVCLEKSRALTLVDLKSQSLAYEYFSTENPRVGFLDNENIEWTHTQTPNKLVQNGITVFNGIPRETEPEDLVKT